MQCVQNNTNISYIRVNDKIINLIDTKSPILNLEKLTLLKVI